MPADELKIDKTLVEEVETSTEVRFVLDAIVDLARGLNMLIVVEGLESSDQAKIVADLGCTVGQGFYFGRPKPAQQALSATISASLNAGPAN